MGTAEKDPILARIEKLEQQNRRLKQGALICVTAVALIAVTGGLMAQTQHKTTKPKPKPAAAATPAEPVVPEKLEAGKFRS